LTPLSWSFGFSSGLSEQKMLFGTRRSNASQGAARLVHLTPRTGETRPGWNR
jgi:hypothetical protein